MRQLSCSKLNCGNHGSDSGFSNRCFQCGRPNTVCYCALIPSIENTTPVLIFQHKKEWSHPFNTAKIAKRALKNCRLVTDYLENIGRHSSLIKTNAGLLYPSTDAVELTHIGRDDLPSQLVFIDGTWNQAKRIFRECPRLHALPRFQINPKSPGNYRIRLEPNEKSLSTLEAIIASLSHVEPQLKDLDRLESCFDAMIDNQLAHPLARYSSSAKPKPQKINLPKKLLTEFDRLVCLYAEAEPYDGSSIGNRGPAVVVAHRNSDSSKLRAVIETELHLEFDHLRHFELKRSEITDVMSRQTFKNQWRQFFRSDDIAVVYNASTLNLFSAMGIEFSDSIEIRSLCFGKNGNRRKTMSEFLGENNYPIKAPEFPGRAGKRLANLISTINFLRNINYEINFQKRIAN